MRMSNQTPKPVPATHKDLAEKPLLAIVSTTLKDGTPQASPVWFNVDADGYFYFNTAQGRVKARALEAHPYASVLIMDPANQFRYLAVRGPVEASIEEGRAHINLLCQRYTGNPVYTFSPPTEVRIRYKLSPQHVLANG